MRLSDVVGRVITHISETPTKDLPPHLILRYKADTEVIFDLTPFFISDESELIGMRVASSLAAAMVENYGELEQFLFVSDCWLHIVHEDVDTNETLSHERRETVLIVAQDMLTLEHIRQANVYSRSLNGEMVLGPWLNADTFIDDPQMNTLSFTLSDKFLDNYVKVRYGRCTTTWLVRTLQGKEI